MMIVVILWLDLGSNKLSDHFSSLSHQQVPDAVSLVHLPLHPQVLPSSVPPPHHLGSLRSRSQTRLPLLPLRSEKVASCSHSSPGFSQRPSEAPTGPHAALLGHTCWPAEEPSTGGWLRRHSSPPSRCYAKTCSEQSGQQWREGEERRRGVVCWEVSLAKCIAMLGFFFFSYFWFKVFFNFTSEPWKLARTALCLKALPYSFRLTILVSLGVFAFVFLTLTLDNFLFLI